MDQNVYWLNTPITPGKARTFTVRAKVSPTLPTAPVAISTVVYALDADKNVACASAMPDATVSEHVCVKMRAKAVQQHIHCRFTYSLLPLPDYHPLQPQVLIKAEDDANKRNRLSRKATECPRPQPGGAGNYYVYAHSQRLLYGQLTVRIASDVDVCYAACRCCHCASIDHMSPKSPGPSTPRPHVLIPTSPPITPVNTYSNTIAHKLFYFSVTAAGQCYCADRPDLVWDSTAMVSLSCPSSIVCIPRRMYMCTKSNQSTLQTQTRRTKQPGGLKKKPDRGCFNLSACVCNPLPPPLDLGDRTPRTPAWMPKSWVASSRPRVIILSWLACSKQVIHPIIVPSFVPGRCSTTGL